MKLSLPLVITALACTVAPSHAIAAPVGSTTGAATGAVTSTTAASMTTGAAPVASTYGDPHFLKWNGEIYDFHGGCDLVMVHSPAFANGAGMDIHVRTKIKTWWSYVESAVVRIGEDTVELKGGDNGGQYFFNGQEHMDGEASFNEHGYTLAGDHKVTVKHINGKQIRIRVDMGDGGAMSIETYKHFVRVNVHPKGETAEFEGSLGMMGSYPKGEMLARDGSTVIEDANEMGLEWQVRVNEPNLFHNLEGAQHPQQCAMPNKSEQRKQRRLGEIVITQEDAERACAHVPEDFIDNCIFDVLATNDKDLAGAY